MGWGGGPLSQGQNAARLCSSRHDAAVQASGGQRGRWSERGYKQYREGVSCSSIPGRQASQPVEGEER
jgi:hypothetical protein